MGGSQERSCRIPLWLDCDPGTKANGQCNLRKTDVLQAMTLVLDTSMWIGETLKTL
jgi:hypothetical protein